MVGGIAAGLVDEHTDGIGPVQVRLHRRRGWLAAAGDVVGHREAGEEHGGGQRHAQEQPADQRRRGTKQGAAAAGDAQEEEAGAVPGEGERAVVHVLRVPAQPPQPEDDAQGGDVARPGLGEHQVRRRQRPRRPHEAHEVAQVQRPVHPEDGSEGEEADEPRREAPGTDDAREGVDAERAQDEVQQDEHVVEVEGVEQRRQP